MDNYSDMSPRNFYDNSNSSSDDEFSSSHSVEYLTLDDFEATSNDSNCQEFLEVVNDNKNSDNVNKSAWKLITSDSIVNHSSFQPSYKEKIQNVNLSVDDHPIKFFELFVTEDLINVITYQTNLYASQVLAVNVSRGSHLNQWTETNPQEMRNFLGLLLWMGLVRYPQIASYWSQKFIYKNDIVPKTMSRNRFEILLRMWHFSNNNEANGDRIFKMNLLNMKLQEQFKKYKIPGQYLHVDESVMPFTGSLNCHGKYNKYDIKLLKLCDSTGYTYAFQVYQGRNEGQKEFLSVTPNIVLKLGESYLNEGRTFITDNYCTSVPLAEVLLNTSTHLVGILRKNQKDVPLEVVSKKLQKNEIIGMFNEKGIVIAKWKDKQELLMLSTSHTLEMISTRKRNRKHEEILKPKIIQDYTAGKVSFDSSDQYSSYTSAVRKSIKWYHNVAMELIFDTTIMNSFLIYKAVTAKKMSNTEFKELIVEGLLNSQFFIKQECGSSKPEKHTLKENYETDQRNRKVKKRCISCYTRNRQQMGSREADKASATPRVSTYCMNCPGQPALCANCFVNNH